MPREVWGPDLGRHGHSTLIAVSTPGSLPPVTDHGLCARLIVHSITATGDIWTVEMRSR